MKRTVAANGPADSDQLRGTGIATLQIDHSKEDNTDGNYLVWGAWRDAATPAVPSPKPEQTFGGSVPHGTPSRTTGSATYVGDAHGHYSGDGITGHQPWKGEVGLTANFQTQRVSGTIANDILEIDAGPRPTDLKRGAVAASGGDFSGTGIGEHITRINLAPARFGDSLSGKVTVRGLGDAEDNAFPTITDSDPFTRNAPSDGTWTGAFYGPTTGDPTGIAGSFSVKRDAAPVTSGPDHVPGKWHGAVGALSVSGAFGADDQTD